MGVKIRRAFPPRAHPVSSERPRTGIPLPPAPPPPAAREHVPVSQKICTQCGRTYEASQKFCPEDGAVLRAPDAAGDLVGTVVAQRYHVLKKLGEGGMGQVYLAEHVRMGRKSALKVMSSALSRDPDAITRFNREAS